MEKRMLALLLATLMVFSLVACGGEENSTEKTEPTGTVADEEKKDYPIDKVDGYVVYNSMDEEFSTKLETPKTPLDPQKVYNSMTYTPQMFYGSYKLFGGDEAEAKYAAESTYAEFKQNNRVYNLTTVPFKISAGKHSLGHSINFVQGYNWARLYFMQKTDDGQSHLYDVLGAYTVEGKTFVFKPLDKWNVDQENNKITYTFTEYEWTYDFSFEGRALTLSRGGKSVTMHSGLNAYGEYVQFSADNYVSEGSKTLDSIDYIDFGYGHQDIGPSLNFVYEDWRDTPEGGTDGIGLFQENGLFTFTVPWATGTKTYQYVYFLCDWDGIILTDGVDTYYYNDNRSDRMGNDVNNYLSEDQTGKLDELSESELEAIVEKKDDLLEDLTKAFEDEGINVTVNEETGELAMDTSVLFGGDSAVLTADGKAFLNKFVKAYTSIVFSDKYKDFISKTMVEGHVAPVTGDTYEDGLPLSKERADNVKNYCVSSETGTDGAKLANSLEAIAYSNSKPIKDKDGNVDMAASRRVSFKFIINLEK